jgi:hypothetical protein
MKSLPDEQQLKDGFIDFAELAVELTGRSERDSKYLKFAAVNAQVALELFLKYFFTKKGRVAEIQKKKNGILQNDFNEYAQILSHYFSTRNWSYGVKRELVSLMEARNSILHRAQQSEWDISLAINVVRTLFFIHSTWYSDFGRCLFERGYGTPRYLSTNIVWRKGVESFINHLAEVHNIEIRTCLACNQHAVVTGEFFGVLGAEGADNLICLNCFDSIDIEHEARLLQCHKCLKNTYIIDAFNEQERQLYVGKCTSCGEDSWVRCCRNCEKFFYPEADEVYSDGIYFCSSDCAENFSENRYNPVLSRTCAKSCAGRLAPR